MRRARFSIRGLMLAIVLMAAAFAALRTPSPFWANAWFSLALAGLTIAVPVAACAPDGERASCLLFAFFRGEASRYLHATRSEGGAPNR